MRTILLTLLLLTAYTTKGQSDSIAGQSLKTAAVLKAVSVGSGAMIPVLIAENNKRVLNNQTDIKPVIIFFGFVAVVTNIAAIAFEYKAGEALNPKRKY